MPQKSVIQRERSAATVRSALDTFAGRIDVRLTELASLHLKHGEAMPDWSFALQLLGRMLGQGAQAMRKADDQHDAELSDDDAPREAREAAVTALYDELVELREVATGLHTTGALKALALVGVTPRDPLTLERYASGVIEALVKISDGTVVLPRSRVKGAALDAKDALRKLRREVAAVTTALDDVRREEREAQVTLSVKQAAIAKHDATFGAVANVTEGMLQLVGEHHLADRVRPSARRPGVTTENETGGDDPVAAGAQVVAGAASTIQG